MGILDTMGPRPDGDPAAMRAFAAQLRPVADTWATLGNGAAEAAAKMTFEGAAGVLVKMHAETLRTRAQAGAGEVLYVAELVEKRAAQIETMQIEWDRRRGQLLAMPLEQQQALSRVR